MLISKNLFAISARLILGFVETYANFNHSKGLIAQFKIIICLAMRIEVGGELHPVTLGQPAELT